VRSCVDEGFFGMNLSVAAGPMILLLLAGVLKGSRLGRKPAWGVLGASLRRASETWGWRGGQMSCGKWGNWWKGRGWLTSQAVYLCSSLICCCSVASSLALVEVILLAV
jgi:hypothetical protein